jgi:uncharacterized protein (TIGR03083 family)
VQPARYLQLLREDGDALATAAEQDLHAHVPSCPDWNMAALVRHTSQVHRHRTALVKRKSTERPDDLEREPGPSDEKIVHWYRTGLEELLDAFATAGPDAPAWTWHGENNVRFWMRRMAQETAVHRWDAQNAAGTPSVIDAELASDGIDEFLDKFIPLDQIPYQGPAGTLHLHCVDVPGEWTVMLEPSEVPSFERGHAKGDAAVRGPAHNLLLWVWRRLDGSAVEVLGDAGRADAFWRYAEGPGQ